MNRAILVAGCLLIGALTNGCSRSTKSGTNRPPFGSPVPVSSSTQVVKLASSPVTIARNGSAEAVVTLTISPGYHINANPASFPYLIATELQPGKLDGITSGKPAYPSPVTRKFEFAEQPLAVYEGQAAIRLPLRAASPAQDQYLMPIKMRVQACDSEKCFPPATIESAIPVKLTAALDD